jgi:hypothetical protein
MSSNIVLLIYLGIEVVADLKALNHTICKVPLIPTVCDSSCKGFFLDPDYITSQPLFGKQHLIMSIIQGRYPEY